jgi:hypothetical protein
VIVIIIIMPCVFRPFYRTEQLIITRTGNHSKVYHPYPPPSISGIDFSPIFDKEFLHQVIHLTKKGGICIAPTRHFSAAVGAESRMCYPG